MYYKTRLTYKVSNYIRKRIKKKKKLILRLAFYHLLT